MAASFFQSGVVGNSEKDLTCDGSWFVSKSCFADVDTRSPCIFEISILIPMLHPFNIFLSLEVNLIGSMLCVMQLFETHLGDV